MDRKEALYVLGVTESTLSEEEKRSLEQDGYVVFNHLIDPVWLEELQDSFEKIVAKEGSAAGKEVHQESGARRLADLVNKGSAFDRVYTHPKVLAAVDYVIGREFKLSSLNGRDAMPGEGLQGLHADWTGHAENEPYHVCNSIWLLDDFTEENGATRVIPGSHKISGNVRDYISDAMADHPDQKLLIAPAGTVAVFNSHVWHGGTTNKTNGSRRAYHCYYTAREFEQQQNQAEYIRQATYDRITPAARYILDAE
jgi:ectoine hydroxylase-related dioxygenase (phytanoyl-CoA dioxygenase family)